jgi:hypothetical protein
VYFVLKVDQAIIDKDSMLPDVTYYAQRPERFWQERFLTLTADDFWTMALDFPFVVERDAPPDRPALDRVPDFPKIIKANGPWIAWKLGVAASQISQVNLRRVTLVTIEEEVGAVELSNCLAAMFGNKPIGVPRAAIEEWEEGGRSQSFVATWLEREAEWAKALTGAPSREAVVLDEFAVTGGSLEGLAELMGAFGLSLRFVGALAAFRRRRAQETFGQRKVFFLYESELIGHNVA